MGISDNLVKSWCIAYRYTKTPQERRLCNYYMVIIIIIKI